MAGEKVDFEAAKAEAFSSAGGRTENMRSTIGFPYFDLEAAESVAQAVYARAGISACPLDELSAEMGVTMSGNFRLKNAAAKLFNLVDKEGPSAFKLTDLGLRLVDDSAAPEARANAFLSVPLYAALYEMYRGKLLPPTKALEREIANLGVSVKQATKARQIFQKSAKRSGFFDSGEDRLVKPRIIEGSGATENPQSPEPVSQTDAAPSHAPQNTYGGNGGGGGYHPFVEGLLQTMPEPGTLWAIEGRAAWLEAAANVFKLMYQGDGKITVSASPEKKTEHDL